MAATTAEMPLAHELSMFLAGSSLSLLETLPILAPAPTSSAVSPPDAAGKLLAGDNSLSSSLRVGVHVERDVDAGSESDSGSDTSSDSGDELDVHETPSPSSPVAPRSPSLRASRSFYSLQAMAKAPAWDNTQPLPPTALSGMGRSKSDYSLNKMAGNGRENHAGDDDDDDLADAMTLRLSNTSLASFLSGTPTLTLHEAYPPSRPGSLTHAMTYPYAQPASSAEPSATRRASSGPAPPRRSASRSQSAHDILLAHTRRSSEPVLQRDASLSHQSAPAPVPSSAPDSISPPRHLASPAPPSSVHAGLDRRLPISPSSDSPASPAPGSPALSPTHRSSHGSLDGVSLSPTSASALPVANLTLAFANNTAPPAPVPPASPAHMAHAPGHPNPPPPRRTASVKWSAGQRPTGPTLAVHTTLTPRVHSLGTLAPSPHSASPVSPSHQRSASTPTPSPSSPSSSPGSPTPHSSSTPRPRTLSRRLRDPTMPPPSPDPSRIVRPSPLSRELGVPVTTTTTNTGSLKRHAPGTPPHASYAWRAASPASPRASLSFSGAGAGGPGDVDGGGDGDNGGVRRDGSKRRGKGKGKRGRGGKSGGFGLWVRRVMCIAGEGAR